MNIQPTNTHAVASFSANVQRQRQEPNATAVTSTDTVTISQAAREIASNEANDAASHDFTSMSPYEFGKLIANGELKTDGFMVLTEAQFQEIAKAQFSGTPVNSEPNTDSAFYAKTDYIRLYADGIKTSKAYGIDTTGMERVLNQMKTLQNTKPRS